MIRVMDRYITVAAGARVLVRMLLYVDDRSKVQTKDETSRDSHNESTTTHQQTVCQY